MSLLSTKAAVLAVDGGGTTCRAVLCGQSGDILGYAEGGPVNYHSIGANRAAENVARLLGVLSPGPLTVECAVFGLAGLDTKADRRILSRIVSTELQAAGIRAEQLLLENDGLMTLAGAVGNGDGLLLVAGTGSIACAKSQAGLTVRVGGWGSRAGDEGSGFFIGMSAIRYMLRALDGREKQSGICSSILQEKCMTDVEQLIDWIYSPQFCTEQAAALTPLICSLADAGDWKASEIIDSAADELGVMAVAAIDRLRLNNTVLHTVLSGGVLQHTPRMQKIVKARILAAAPQAQFAPPLYQPIIGGAMLGFRSCRLDAQAALERMVDGMRRLSRK